MDSLDDNLSNEEIFTCDKSGWARFGEKTKQFYRLIREEKIAKNDFDFTDFKFPSDVRFIASEEEFRSNTDLLLPEHIESMEFWDCEVDGDLDIIGIKFTESLICSGLECRNLNVQRCEFEKQEEGGFSNSIELRDLNVEENISILNSCLKEDIHISDNSAIYLKIEFCFINEKCTIKRGVYKSLGISDTIVTGYVNISEINADHEKKKYLDSRTSNRDYLPWSLDLYENCFGRMSIFESSFDNEPDVFACSILTNTEIVECSFSGKTRISLESLESVFIAKSSFLKNETYITIRGLELRKIDYSAIDSFEEKYTEPIIEIEMPESLANLLAPRDPADVDYRDVLWRKWTNPNLNPELKKFLDQINQLDEIRSNQESHYTINKCEFDSKTTLTVNDSNGSLKISSSEFKKFSGIDSTTKDLFFSDLKSHQFLKIYPSLDRDSEIASCEFGGQFELILPNRASTVENHSGKPSSKVESKADLVIKEVKFLGLTRGLIHSKNKIESTDPKILFDDIYFPKGMQFVDIDLSRIKVYKVDVQHVDFVNCEFPRKNGRIWLEGTSKSNHKLNAEFYRSLKKSQMEEKNWELAGDAYRSEMVYTRKQKWMELARNPLSPGRYVNLFIVMIYGVFSGFQQSMAKPLYWLALSWAFFTLIYFNHQHPIMSINFWQQKEFLTEAMTISFYAMLPIAGDIPDSDIFNEGVMITQRLLSTILLAFFVVATRARLRQ